ncbi:NlpC/P60 family protein [Pseudogemmobacter humi]|uniref:Gamma-D-glutamyl-L-lysine endopeptidase n=1 Tax=Pseudogemmobacter humi TaxID=2483812 RepID=A0A3P5WV69_9RHOB|nr:NlpC/P60 family protein [Pseudogemmobacter humi]VDC25272.1 Gamma-D-glutamyl-L-lysine endopeptidase [Pseudogemmobacter humi]
MSDRRLTPFSGRIGHISLKDRGVPLTAGEPACVAAPLAALRAAPGGAMDRQLLFGDAVTVIDRRDGHAFVMAGKDGYCGWLAEQDLAAPRPATHRLCSPASHLYPEPRVQAPPLHPLYLNARLTVTGESGPWAETPQGYVPAIHLAPLGQPAKDPVAVAESLIGAPYLWGGNSVAGVDCSGLVQLAFHAAGLACPGDSDLQQEVGAELPETAPLKRGDLLFWKGHVALVAGPGRLLHANGYTMSVAYEDLDAATARIETHYGGQILARRRAL